MLLRNPSTVGTVGRMTAIATRPFLSVTELGERLGVSTRTAYKLVSERVVPVVEIRGVKKVPAAALDQWISDRSREALAAVQDADPAP